LSFKRLDLQNNVLKQAYLNTDSVETEIYVKQRNVSPRVLCHMKKKPLRAWFFFEETFKTQKSANTSGSELKANHRNPTRIFQVEAELY
jgi:hypothetical protein